MAPNSPQAPGVGHGPPLGHMGASDGLLLAPLGAAKTESCKLRRLRPQEGQASSPASAARRTSFSNFVPQSSQ